MEIQVITPVSFIFYSHVFIDYINNIFSDAPVFAPYGDVVDLTYKIDDVDFVVGVVVHT